MKITLTDKELATAVFEYLQKRNQRQLTLGNVHIDPKAGAVIAIVHEKTS